MNIPETPKIRRSEGGNAKKVEYAYSDIGYSFRDEQFGSREEAMKDITSFDNPRASTDEKPTVIFFDHENPQAAILKYDHDTKSWVETNYAVKECFDPNGAPNALTALYSAGGVFKADFILAPEGLMQIDRQLTTVHYREELAKAEATLKDWQESLSKYTARTDEIFNVLEIPVGLSEAAGKAAYQTMKSGLLVTFTGDLIEKAAATPGIVLDPVRRQGRAQAIAVQNPCAPYDWVEAVGTKKREAEISSEEQRVAPGVSDYLPNDDAHEESHALTM